MNQNGEIILSGTASYPLVGSEMLGVSWDVGFETTLNKAQSTQYSLFILYQDDNGQIVQQEYAINEPFEVNFSDEQWVKKIHSVGDGNIIVEVEHKVAQSSILASSKPEAAPDKTTPDNTTQDAKCSAVSLTLEDTNQGDILHMQCGDWSYDSPYLAKGIYAIDPENDFFVYCSNAGDVYMMKIGDSSLSLIKNLQAEMSAFKTGTVYLEMKFIEDGSQHHFVRIKDLNTGQNAMVKVPSSFPR
jgi:hypothetical protein